MKQVLHASKVNVTVAPGARAQGDGGQGGPGSTCGVGMLVAQVGGDAAAVMVISMGAR